MEEFTKDPIEVLGVVSYLSIMRKYPEAREDILELRRQKNRALKYIIGGTALFSFLLGYFIAGFAIVYKGG